MRRLISWLTAHHIDRSRSHHKEQPMLDFILLDLGLGFFALSIAYAFGCDHL
jgi:hypothetical protein